MLLGVPMSDMPIRIRVRYSKAGNLRFIGHLDTQRLFERALRRAGLPIRYTQGFSKHMRLNLASALPLGFVSSAEMLDFWLDEPLATEEICEKLQEALPADIQVIELDQVDNSLPSLQGSLLASDYKITLPEEKNSEEYLHKLEQLLAQSEIPIIRRKKTVDYKPLILDYSLQVDSQTRCTLHLKLSSTAGGNARPDDILKLLDVNPADCVIERVGLFFSSLEG